MSNELEPFRRAAELGCPDFGVLGHTADFKLPEPFVLEDACSEIMLPAGTEGTAWFKENGKRINRYAAAVCAELWRERIKECEEGRKRLEAGCGCFSYDHWLKTEPLDRVDELCRVYATYGDLIQDSQRMIDLCREFARKHGGSA